MILKVQAVQKSKWPTNLILQSLNSEPTLLNGRHMSCMLNNITWDRNSLMYLFRCIQRIPLSCQNNAIAHVGASFLCIICPFICMVTKTWHSISNRSKLRNKCLYCHVTTTFVVMLTIFLAGIFFPHFPQNKTICIEENDTIHMNSTHKRTKPSVANSISSDANVHNVTERKKRAKTDDVSFPVYCFKVGIIRLQWTHWQ